MNVASSDDELHEDFLSGEEFASASDDLEVPKDPQMTYQTRSASSHAETPAAVSPEPTEAPFIPKVEQSSSHSTSFSHTTTHCSTVHRRRNHQRYHRQPHHHTWNYLRSRCPQSRAMKRPLEQIPQPESKRIESW